MRILTVIGAYFAAAAVAYVAAVAFISQRIIADQQAVGGAYDLAQQWETFVLNLPGLAAMGYGGALAAALAVGFLLAAAVKRLLTPLAPIAYPVAGAAAVITVLWLINTYMTPPGVGGAIPGARSTIEVVLQGLAGAIGGLVFEFIRPKS